ncbi:MAG: DUF4129 domain-containing protein [Chloroflexi bacterium]|nr:DUF4129 domain-containing protein [Chloroflexota bacterium]
MNQQSPKQAYRDFHDVSWTGSVFRSLLIAVLATSALAGPLALLHTTTMWRLSYVPPLAFLVALEGVYSTLRRGRPAWRDRRGLLFRLGEVVAVLIILRLATWVFSTELPGLVQLTLWLRHPSSFFDGEFVLVGALLLAAWGLAVAITSDFLDLAIQPDEVAAHDSHDWSDSASQWRVFRPMPRSEIAGRFILRWSLGGVVVVLFAALSQLTVSFGENAWVKLNLLQLGLPPEVLAGLLCYFLAGLLLASQARLAMLRGRWYNEKLDIGAPVLRRWHQTSFLAVLLVAGLAALLPIGSTGPLATALEFVIALAWRIASLLGMLLVGLMALLLYPLRYLFSQLSEETPQLAQPRLNVPTQAEATSRLPDWLGGVVLWIVLALIAGYFLVSYLQAHGLLRGRLADVLTALRFWWRARWARLNASAQAATAALRAVLRRTPVSGPVAHSQRPVRLSDLGPREKVRYFYLRALQRAADRGVIRPVHRTPLEFAGDLESQWPAAEDDVRELTEAFLAARYDRRDIAVTQAQAIQSVWRRLMAALRDRVGEKASQ